MELKILQKNEEPLLSRTRVESEVLFEKATPSNKEIKTKLAQVLGNDEKLLDVIGIYTIYGLKKATILCYAYENEEVLKKIRIESKKKGQKVEKKEEVKQEVKKEDKAEAKPKEAKEDKKEAKQEDSKEQKKEKQ